MGGRPWTRMHLGDFVTLQRGHDLPDAIRRPGNTPILGSFGVTGWHDEAIIAGPGVTVGRSGASLGVVSYSTVAYWPLNTALYVTDFHGNDQHFAYYFLKQFDFRAYNSGSAQPSLNRNFIHPIPVDVPPLPEQRVIAHILGTLDDKIELNRRMNETLEEMARALFKSWFVDFDPVRAKMEGRWRPGESLPGLPAEYYDLFPDRLAPSELGEIPEGWEVKALGDVAMISSGKRPPVKFTTSSASAEVPVYGGNGPMAFTTEALSFEPVLITGRVGTLGTVFRVTSPCWPSDNTLVIRPLRRQLFEFLFFRMQGIDSMALNRGSTQPLLTQSDLKAEPLVSPGFHILEDFAQSVGTLFTRIDDGQCTADGLAAIRDTLLPKLVSGEIRVDNLDDAVFHSTDVWG